MNSVARSSHLDHDRVEKLRILACPVAFNEEKKIGSVLDRFHLSDVDEVAVLDDGSTDGTPDEVTKRGATLLQHPRRRGVGAAIRTVIKYARENHFDILVIMAGSDKDRAEEIPRLVEPIVKGGYDFVQGSRYLPGGNFGNMPAYRRVATQVVHPWLFSLATQTRITDSTNGFRAFRLSLFDDPRINLEQAWLDQYELEPYVFFKALTLGYNVKEVPVTKIYPEHSLGYTKMKPIIGWWSILRPILLLGLRLRK